ncbi:MAG TPA: DUF2142 domain-containing protein [Nonomuraea sp.]|nr:DUF2142 domain-containing protein [Nonomuraea sp.]
MPHVRLRSLSRPLAALTVLHLGLLLTWSVIVPTFRGADEHVHHDLIRRLAQSWRYPEYDRLEVSRRTLDALSTSPAFPAHAPAVAARAATRRADRAAWSDLGPDVRTGPPNQMPQHPPLYYETAAAVLRVVDGDGDAPLDLAVWELRLLSILAMAPLPLLAADIARRFSRSPAVILSAAAAVLAVPQLTHLGATVSNDPFMILLGSATLAGAARLATGDRRWATAATTGVAAGLALFTKGFAIPLVPAVALACLLPLATRGREDAREAERPPTKAGTWGRAGLVASLALAFGGWWWVHNVLAYGTPQPGVRLRDRVPNVELDKLRFLGDFSERLVSSFWGYFGWREVHLPLVVTAGMTALVVATALLACRRCWSRVVLLVPAAVATSMVLSSGWGAFKKTGVSYATQGRYLFAGIAGLAVLVSLGVARLTTRQSSWQPLTTLALALTLQGAGLWLCLHRYWAGAGTESLRAMVRFAPIPGAVTAGVLLLTAAAALAALVAMAVDGRRTTIDPS